MTTPNAAAALDYIQNVFKGEGYLAVFTDYISGRKETRAFHTSKLEEAAGYIDAAAGVGQPYVATGLYATAADAIKRSGGLVKSVSYFTIDIDVAGPTHSQNENAKLPPNDEEALAGLEGLPQVSWLLHTGGGFRAVYVLDQPYSPGATNVAAIMRAVQAKVKANYAVKGYHLDNTADLARTSRTPGTYNRKKGGKVPVRVIERNNVEYPLSAFEEFLPLIERPKRERRSGDLKDGEVSVELVREMLEAITCDELEYQDWLAVLYVLYANFDEGTAMALAEEWVSSGARERNGLLEAKFASFGDKEYVWTIAKLISIARKAGWTGRVGKGRKEQAPLDVEDDLEVLGLHPLNLRVHQQYLDIELPSTKGIIVRSAMGTGKSVWLSKVVKAHQGSVLNLGHRVSLLRALASQFELDFYLDQDLQALRRSDRLAITLESLYKIDTERRYSLLVIDEVEQVLNSVVASKTTRGKRGQIIEYLRFLVARADKVIVADADASERTVGFLRRTLGMDFTVVVNTFRKDGLTVYRHENQHNWRAALVRRLREGKKLYVAVNSRKEAIILAGLLRQEVPNSQVAVITGENSLTEEGQALIGDINNRVLELDALVASPSLGTGVSIDVEHFDEVFLLGFGEVNTHRDLAQQMSRVRNPKERAVHAWVDPRAGEKPTNPEELRRWALDNYLDTKGLLDAYEAEVQVRLDFQTGGRSHADEFYFKLWSEIWAGRNRSTNAFAANFFAHCEEIGHEVEDAEEEDENEVKAVNVAHKEVKESSKTRHAEEIAQAPVLHEGQMAELEGKRVLTAEQKAAKTKTRLLTAYGVTEVTPELVKADEDGLYAKVQNLAGLLDTDYAKRLDQRETGWEEMPDRRHLSAASQLRAEVLKFSGVRLDAPGERIEVSPGFVDWARRNTDRIQRLLGVKVGADIERSPLKLTGAVLRQLGMKLKTKKSKTGGVEVEYRILDVDTLAVMRGYVEHHLAQSAPRAATVPDEAVTLREVVPF